MKYGHAPWRCKIIKEKRGGVINDKDNADRNYDDNGGITLEIWWFKNISAYIIKIHSPEKFRHLGMILLWTIILVTSRREIVIKFLQMYILFLACLMINDDNGVIIIYWT